MYYLLIQSKGEAPIESYTLLGASLSRNEDGLIGQFGSGSKLAICTLLRKGLKVFIYSGLTCMEFRTKTVVISDDINSKQEEQVYIQFSGASRKKLDLGWTLGYGAMDWQDEAMGLREFICNAIDHTVKRGESVRDASTDRDLAIEIVPEDMKRAQKGYTRIFIEESDAINDYVDNLCHHFLHFSAVDLGKQILPKVGDRKKAQIFFNGVYVCELANSPDSLCDYNFRGKQIEIDESRNLSEYASRAAIARLYQDAGVEDLVTVFTALKRNTTCLETGLDSYYLKPSSYAGASEKQKENWLLAWEKVNGDAVACGHDQGIVGEFARKKGHDLSLIHEASMLDTVQAYGVPGVNEVVNDNERKGRTITAPSFEAIDAVNTVWSWITATDLIDEEKCPKPTVKGFDEITDAESECTGFYKPGEPCVYLRNDQGGDTLLETALEEVTHYVTGATDASRDFQNFIMRLFIRWMK